MDWHREVVRKWAEAGVRMAEEAVDEGPRPLEGLTVVVTGTLAGYSRDQAAEAIAEPGRQGQRLGLQEDRASWWWGTTPGSKADKAASLKVPVLDEDGFRVLLDGARTPPGRSLSAGG